MRSLLVTGASGYLGGELVRRASARGLTVTGTFLTREPDGPGTRVRADVRDAAAVERALAAVSPDCVVHTAYRQDGPDAWTTNVEGAATVARASAAADTRLIHLSSDLVFGGELGHPYTEDDEPNPVSDYGRSKLAGERAVADACPGALLVRTSLLYGGPEPSNHERLAIDAAKGRSDVAFFTDEIRSPVAVGDLAEALLELAALGASGPLHVAGADAVSRYEFACLVASSCGLPINRLKSGFAIDAPTPRPRNCALDSSRARALLTTPVRGVREVLG